MDISAKQVMELRQATGMPMMKCKKALLEAEGDFERAVEILRKEGLKAADKRAGRKTSEGLIAVRLAEDGRSGTMVQVLCESEPVKNTPKFTQFVESFLAAFPVSFKLFFGLILHLIKGINGFASGDLIPAFRPVQLVLVVLFGLLLECLLLLYNRVAG